MFHSAKLLRVQSTRSFSRLIEASEEVRHALAHDGPVVALESTILTHGMPYPDNVECARVVEEIVRNQGAVPATIAVIGGRIRAGLDGDQLDRLGRTGSSRPVKTSRRDLARVVQMGANGGTTVAGTLVIASRLGIRIFATGGIGGVHRGAEATFDVSADLVELGRSDVAVVSSGVKSILDIPKTLEYLETQGVFVATFGSSDDFPAFYSRTSGSKAPYSISDAQTAAEIMKINRELRLNSGMLFAVPIPEQYSIDNAKMEAVIAKALKNMRVKGKAVTPYLLGEVARITEGKSLESNIALIKNNAKVAADIAVALSGLENGTGNNKLTTTTETGDFSGVQPVVIGGSTIDCSATVQHNEIKLNGQTYDTAFSYSPGGVARNICESLGKLGLPPLFISAIGDDENGETIRRSLSGRYSDGIETVPGLETSQCTIVFDGRGDNQFLMMDRRVHRGITPETIRRNEESLRRAPLIVIDANASSEAIEEVLRLALKHTVPVFFEPTDLSVCSKPFKTKHWQAIKFITPNVPELHQIASTLGLRSDGPRSTSDAASIAADLVPHVDNVIVTLGSGGVLIGRRGPADRGFVPSSGTDPVSVRLYPTEVSMDVVNVSGAGDGFASGLAAGIVGGLSEEVCVSVGFEVAGAALRERSAVPERLFDRTHGCWSKAAQYQTII